jgi:hypothetical protein
MLSASSLILGETVSDHTCRHFSGNPSRELKDVGEVINADDTPAVGSSLVFP